MVKKNDGLLEDIHIKENSGVDEPAHLTPGWIVMKQADTDALDSRVAAIIQEAELMAKSHSELTNALAASESFFQDAPTPVQAAAKLLSNYLRGTDAVQAEGDEYPDPNKKVNDAMDAEDKKEAPEDGKPDAEDAAEGEDGYGYPLPNKKGQRPTKKEFVEFLLDGGALDLYNGMEKSRVSKKHLNAFAEAVKALDSLYKSFTDEETITKGNEVSEEIAKAAEEATAEEVAPTTEEAPSELATIAKSVNDVADKMTQLTEQFTTALEDLGARIDTVESARGIRKSLDGQETDVKKTASLWGNVIPRTVN